MSDTTQLLRLTQIRTDGGTQMRAALNHETVTEYADAMRRSETFPPVAVYYDGSAYWLGDGFHRVQAAYHAYGHAYQIAAIVHSGTRRDAILHAAGANADHGIRRTNADKRRAVEALLRDEEWGTWSDREIARICNVSHPMVADVRSLVTGNSSSDQRTYTTKHGTTATMQTAKNAQKIYELRHSFDDADPAPTTANAAVDAPSQPNRTDLTINDAVELVWAALGAEKFHPPILPAKITSLKNSPEVAFTRYLRPGETVTDDTLYAAKGKVEAALILQMEHCTHAPWPASPTLSSRNRCDICGKPAASDPLADDLKVSASPAPAVTTQTAQPVGDTITETLDEAVRRATCVYTGSAERWQALVATGADYWQILDLLKSIITNAGGSSGPGMYTIERKRGPIITISQGLGGPVVAKLMSGRLVEAVRRAWAIPEKAGAQSLATQDEDGDDEPGPLCSVIGCYQSAIAERGDGSPVCAGHVSGTEDSAGEPASLPGADTDHRLTTAAAILRSIDALLSDLEGYGALTGRYTDIPPVERNVRVMRAELLKFSEVLKGAQP